MSIYLLYICLYIDIVGRVLAWPGDDVVRRGDPRIPQRARLLRAPRDGGAAAGAVR